MKVGDYVEFSAEFRCRTHISGALNQINYGAAGIVVEIHSNRQFARVKWWRGIGWAGTTTLVAISNLWADGYGIRNECPRCAKGKCGGAFDWRGSLERMDPWRD